MGPRVWASDRFGFWRKGPAVLGSAGFNVGALIIRIGFWALLMHRYNIV